MLISFRNELEELTLEELEKEAGAVVAQLLERDTKLSQEASTFWGEILQTESLPSSTRKPAFDRVERIAQAFYRLTPGADLNYGQSQIPVQS